MKQTLHPGDAARSEFGTWRSLGVILVAASLVICGSGLSFVYSERAIARADREAWRAVEAVAQLTAARLREDVVRRVCVAPTGADTGRQGDPGSADDPDPVDWVLRWQSGRLEAAPGAPVPPKVLIDAASATLRSRGAPGGSATGTESLDFGSTTHFLVLHAAPSGLGDESLAVCFVNVQRFLALGRSALPATDADFELVDVEPPAPADGVALPGIPARFCLVPTDRFRQQGRLERVRHGLLLGPVSLLAVAALIGLIWRLQRLARQEAELLRLQADFVSGVSHELKTPLALIHLFAETLLEDRVPTSEKKREYYDIILRESSRLTHLINNVLDFSRLRSGERAFQMSVQDVGEAVRSMYEAYRAELDHAGMTHALSVAADLPLARIDRDAIGQAVLNLMSNAVKYSEDERWILVEVSRDTRRGRHGVLISVHDRGIGIRPEDRGSIFDGFFRAPDPRVRKRRGAGLGLALVRQIVEAHGGIVSVESRLVGGSTFRIFIPAVPDSEDGARRPTEAGSQ